MPKVTLFFITSLILLLYWGKGSPFGGYSQSARFDSFLPGLPVPEIPGSALWRGLVTGDDQGFPAQEKKAYYQLGLGHLLTPSGTHLQGLNPLIRKLPYPGLFYGALGGFSLLILGFGALTRVAWLKTVAVEDAFWPFIGLMVLDGVLFSWEKSHLSWICSWYFLGCSYFAPKRTRGWWFFLGQLLLSWILFQPLSPLANVFNFLIMIPLIVLFPLVLAASFIPAFFFHEILLNMLGYLHQFVLMAHQHHPLPWLRPHCGHLLLVFCWCVLKGAPRTWILPLLVLGLSAPLDLYKAPSPSMSKWESTMGKCRSRWVGDMWREQCRPPIRRTAQESRKLSSAR